MKLLDEKEEQEQGEAHDNAASLCLTTGLKGLAASFGLEGRSCQQERPPAQDIFYQYNEILYRRQRAVSPSTLRYSSRNRELV